MNSYGSTESTEEKALVSETIESFNPRVFIEDNMYHETNFPLGNSYPSKKMSYKPVVAQNYQHSPGSMCLLGSDGCVPLCSGDTKNPCNVVAPIPGPTWQVQSAEAVQYRLKNGMYTPSNCSIGPSVLRTAPTCSNITSDQSRESQSVECVAAQVPSTYKSPS